MDPTETTLPVSSLRSRFENLEQEKKKVPPLVNRAAKPRAQLNLPEVDGCTNSRPVPATPGKKIPTLAKQAPSPEVSRATPDLNSLPPRPKPSTLAPLIPSPVVDRSLTPSPTPKHAPPALPPPRRSLDIRRSLDVRRSLDMRTEPTPLQTLGYSRADDREDFLPTDTELEPGAIDFPDASQANRRPPYVKQRPQEIVTGYDTKLIAICGDYVCTTGYVTRVWNILTGESVVTITHGDGLRVTALAWEPANNIADEGKRLWLGMSNGDIRELDIASRDFGHGRPAAHGHREVMKFFRHASQLWTLDSDGRLHIWQPGPDGIPTLSVQSSSTLRVRIGHTASVPVGEELWIATGKDIGIFRPNAQAANGFEVLRKPLRDDFSGEVTSAATISSRPNEVYFGHSDGKISVYDKTRHVCLGVHNVSSYKVSTLTGVGNYLWAGYNTGMIYVYDTSTTPWTVKKDWMAHDGPISSIVADNSSLWKLDCLQVVSLAADNVIRIWDGLLRLDWMESRMQEHDNEFCYFDGITAAVMTWNAGASKPTYLRNSETDNKFFREYLSSHAPPDIFVFGFQELVDLEDKKVTAKSFFKSRKKDPTEQDHMSRQYRSWRDHLVRSLDELMPPDQTYTVLHTATMVGLFTCVLVKNALRPRITNIGTAEIKRGMGGLHGNKGALILRMLLDDSSICLINCHLAAGQTQTTHRNTDIATILESECLPSFQGGLRDVFVGGGDGAKIMDHEICILNGDLNYRIDAMTRDAVVKSIKDNNLAKLIERDQLMLSRKRNAGFRLRTFKEMALTFPPTYKYDVGTDNYDTSEKRRSPAWCDRILFRGKGRVKGIDYRRWDLRVSDHRPVTGFFKLRIKRIDPKRRQVVWAKVEAESEQFVQKAAQDIKLDYLCNVLGLGRTEAVNLLR